MISSKTRSLSPVLAVFLAAFAIGAVYAQPRAPAFGKSGEPARIRVAITPTMVGSWTGLVAHDKEYWKKHLPPSSRVDIEFALRGPVVAAALHEGQVHIGYS